ncbi:MAG: DegT/DnrJ/EryC1/StrS aminotransferase family protein [bacterium]|nr:DegT/DnrJ/EryC1/StrS aminotransferase family protein [bacterium]
MDKKLAIDGGTPIRKNPMAAWPYFPDSDIQKVNAVLRSGKVNYWTGDECKKFEKEYATYLGRKYTMAVANGTIALEMALSVHGIGKGDDVIVTPRTFMASASCVVTQGARPVFADIDPVSQNITVDTIERAITPNTKAIIPVHLAGWPCDMDPIMELAERLGILVLEDCAQSHGSKYKGRHTGSIGHIAAFSFCQDKIFTTGGDGGLIATDDESIWKKLWSLKEHGKDFDLAFNTEHPPGFRWLHKHFGSNYRLTEMQASLGRSALERLDEDVILRRKNATSLNECLSQFSCIRRTIPCDEIYHSYYKFYCFVNSGDLASGWSRDRVVAAIAAEGVPCLTGSCSEIYLEQAYADGLRPKERLPIAKSLGETAIMFLVHPTLTVQDVSDTCTAITKVLSQAQK